jgi:hypothetical protein
MKTTNGHVASTLVSGVAMSGGAAAKVVKANPAANLTNTKLKTIPKLKLRMMKLIKRVG